MRKRRWQLRSARNIKRNIDCRNEKQSGWDVWERRTDKQKKNVCKMKKNWDAKRAWNASFPLGMKVYRQKKKTLPPHERQTGFKISWHVLKTLYSVIDYHESADTHKLLDLHHQKELKNRMPADRIKNHLEQVNLTGTLISPVDFHDAIISRT